MPKVKKVVIPAAGLGTRFLPATKASPKEMLTVVDKPLIQFAAEEAFDAGITELIFIISRNKNVIEDHFDKSYELESELEKKNKRGSLELVKQLVPQGVTCTYIRQAEPLGLGHAVLCAASAVNDENFAVLLPDDLIKSDNRGCLKQMLEEFEEGVDAILAVEKISLSESKKYGIIDPGARRGRIIDVNGIIEKPQPQDASSDFGVVGRYIFTPKILSLLREAFDATSESLIEPSKIFELVTEPSANFIVVMAPFAIFEAVTLPSLILEETTELSANFSVVTELFNIFEVVTELSASLLATTELSAIFDVVMAWSFIFSVVTLMSASLSVVTALSANFSEVTELSLIFSVVTAPSTI